MSSATLRSNDTGTAITLAESSSQESGDEYVSVRLEAPTFQANWSVYEFNSGLVGFFERIANRTTPSSEKDFYETVENDLRFVVSQDRLGHTLVEAILRCGLDTPFTFECRPAIWEARVAVVVDPSALADFTRRLADVLK